MKSILKNYKKATMYFVMFVALVAFASSCQEEEIIVENPPPEESIVANSTLSIAMRMMATNEIEVAVEDIDCIDFVYPISFSVYNPQFVIIDTVVINNAQELLVFLATLGINNQIVSLNYPVSLEKEDGTILEANNNTELLDIIVTALTECDAIVDPMNPCPALIIDSYLQECFWFPSLYNGSNEYFSTQFTFNNDGTANVTNAANSGYSLTPLYEVTEDGLDTFLTFSGTQAPVFDPFNGTWKIIECADNLLTLVNEDNTTMVLERNCGQNFALCIAGGITICDDDGDGMVTADLAGIYQGSNCSNSSNYYVSWFVSVDDAFNNVNMLPPLYTFPLPAPEIRLFYAFRDVSDNSLLYVDSFFFESNNCEPNCDNPGILTDDLIVYIPFGSEARELIGGQLLNFDSGRLVEDREGNPSCASHFIQGDDPIFIAATADNELVPGDNFSISLWFRMRNDDAGDLEIMFSTGNGLNTGVQLGVYDLNTPLFVVNDPLLNLWDDDWNQQIDVVWTNQDWHHLVVTFNDDTVRLYRDGILRKEEAGIINIGSAAADGYVLNATTSTGNFVGELDDFRLYRKALNDNEIFTLFNLEGDCFDCLD